MGRMFRIITEGPIEAVTAGAALAHSRESEPFVAGDAPYIEVGGPAPVFHLPKTAPRTSPLEQTPPPAKSKSPLNIGSVPFPWAVAAAVGRSRTLAES